MKLPRGMKSLLEKKEVTHVILPQYGVAILEEQAKHSAASRVVAELLGAGVWVVGRLRSVGPQTARPIG